jgi:hypothetical protein
VAILKRVVHISKLAFFVSLGVAATILDACSSDDETSRTGAGGTSPGAAGASGSGQTSGGTASTPQGGAKATGGTAGQGGTSTTPIADAGTDLWDVICE